MKCKHPKYARLNYPYSEVAVCGICRKALSIPGPKTLKAFPSMRLALKDGIFSIGP